MEKIYLVTGATGFLGREVTKLLTAQQKKVIGLRLPGDKMYLLPGVEYIIGDITKPCSLKRFFEQAEGKAAVLIHCAGLVSVASEEERIWNVNVDGTRNIVDLCEKYRIHKLLYVRICTNRLDNPQKIWNNIVMIVENKRKAYETDLTDSQWEIIEPLMWKSGNKSKWEKRELINAVLYIVDSGCKWRQLPHDFPPHTTVSNFYYKAVREGLWDKILKVMVIKTRKEAGKSSEPSYALIDPKLLMI